MEKKIRVLGIAPYESMKSLLSSLADEYPDMDLDIYVGDLQNGVEIAKRNFHANYDVIISRGGTAKMLQKQVPLPVIEIENSINDILYALKLADGLSGRTAIISFSNITASARMLNELLDYRIDIYTIDSLEDVEPALRNAQKQNYDTILCDMITNTEAKRLGINAFLITSGIESLRQALNRAMFLCHSQSRLRNENQFLRELIRGQIGQTIVFYTDGNLFYSTIDNPPAELLEMLRGEIAVGIDVSERRIIRNISGLLYSIRIKRMSGGERDYVAFFFSSRKAPLISNQCGIQFFSFRESEEMFFNSIYSVSGALSELQDSISDYNKSSFPVMISGEDGTGKEQIANVLYTRSNLRNKPYIFINCSMLNEKSWTFLLEHHNSPLTDMNNTLYFSSIDELTQEHRRQLLAVLAQMDVCKRNRVLFSCVSRPGETITAAGMEFVDMFSCLTLYLPALRQSPGRIPPLINLFLNHLNVNLVKQIHGVEPAAMRLLQEFNWPHNYTQLKRVINELAITAAGSTITAEEVQSILSREKNTATFYVHSENTASPLDLNRTMKDIEKDIAHRVLYELDGNQTAAAKRLGISRTTLWRIVRE